MADLALLNFESFKMIINCQVLIVKLEKENILF